MERRDVIVIGGGPAGSATALYLACRDPTLARRTLVLERARHPRFKVCAGGLIPHTLDCLDELGIGLTVPHVMVDRARVDVPARTVEVAGQRFAAIVRRDEFDAALLSACCARGVEVHEGEKVRQVARDGTLIRVTTDRAEYLTPLVVGADGSGSLVRRTLFPSDAPRATMGRAVMADVPLAAADRWDGHRAERYDFDFRAVPEGLAGYAWAFPCLIDGVPHVNAGVYARRVGGQVDLRALLRRLEGRLGGGRARHCAAPIRCFGPAPFVAPGVLLVGDAAGAEPLMGEGISFAFEYGRWAAEEIAAAIAQRDFTLGTAEARFRRSWVGTKLHRLDQASRVVYGRGARVWFGLAARWAGAQEIGLAWYNGVDGWDRRSGWAALGAALASPLRPRSALKPGALAGARTSN